MSKAVLVMDMPKRCYECPFGNDDAECDVVGRHFNQKKEKPDWCPLRPMPEKKPEEVPIAYTHFGAYKDGWNACIDAIGGGEDD